MGQRALDVNPDWHWHAAVDDTPQKICWVSTTPAALAAELQLWRSGGDLDTLSAAADAQTGGGFSLRWVMLHMIEETARHNGHVDLIREAIDGSVGE